VTHEQWFQHDKNVQFNSCTMLIIENMSKKSLTIIVQCVNKVKCNFNFHINNLTWAYTSSQDSSRPKLGGGHHLPLYTILCDTSLGLHPNNIFLGLLSREFHNSENWDYCYFGRP